MHLDTVVSAEDRIGAASIERGDETTGRAVITRVLVGLAVLALLVALGWRLFGGSEPGTPGDERMAAVTAESNDGTLPPDSANVQSAFVEVTRFLAVTLERITDEASARAVLPDIKEAHTRIGTLRKSTTTLPESDREALVPLVDTALDELRPLADRVLGTPGSGGVVKPVLVPLLDAIEGFPG